MELSNEFVVPVAIDEAWGLLTDVERIAPCMPGAELQEIEGDEYRGIVKVKVGPITAQYKGKATFVEKDDGAHRAVLRAEGRDTRGQGNANATITATLVPEESGTRVTVVTDLAITGRAAQFGRGVMADVSTKLLGQFVSCLEKNVLGSAAAAAPASASSASAAAATEAAPAPVDARRGAAGSVAVAGGVVFGREVRRSGPRVLIERARRSRRVAHLALRRAFALARLRTRRAGEEELDEFHVHTAEQVFELLGGMKGAIMKLGQMLSIVAE